MQQERVCNLSFGVLKVEGSVMQLVSSLVCEPASQPCPPSWHERCTPLSQAVGDRRDTQRLDTSCTHNACMLGTALQARSFLQVLVSDLLIHRLQACQFSVCA